MNYWKNKNKKSVNKMEQTWEYTKSAGEASTEQMNDLGAGGWENYWNVSDPYGRIDTMFWKRQV